jgi:hypothetical protein
MYCTAQDNNLSKDKNVLILLWQLADISIDSYGEVMLYLGNITLCAFFWGGEQYHINQRVSLDCL